MSKSVAAAPSEEDSAERASGRLHHAGAAILWGLTLLGFLAARLTGAWPGDSEIGALGVATALMGIWIFWQHGGVRVTAAGIYGLAAAVFGGFSAVVWTLQPGSLPTGYFTSTMGIALTTWAMWAFFWGRELHASCVAIPASPSASRLGTVVGVILSVLAGGYTLKNVGTADQSSSAAVPIQVALGAMSLLIIALVVRSEGRVRLAWQLFLGVLLVAIFAKTIFTGYGRLNLVALALPGAIIASSVSSRRVVKLGMLLAIWPALLFFGRMRQEFLTQNYGGAASADQFGGAASVFTPLRDCSRVIYLVSTHQVDVVHGQTFWAAATFWIPRSQWPDKPVGFGGVLNQLLGGQSPVAGQSFAALIQGEWIFNFGIVGLIPLVVLVGLYVRWLDGRLAASLGRPLDSLPRLLWFSVVVMLTCDLPNLLWGGTFAYISRVALRAAIPVGLVCLALIIRRRTRELKPDGPPPELASSRGKFVT